MTGHGELKQASLSMDASEPLASAEASATRTSSGASASRAPSRPCRSPPQETTAAKKHMLAVTDWRGLMTSLGTALDRQRKRRDYPQLVAYSTTALASSDKAVGEPVGLE